jgi:hypothetical protein
MENRFQFCDKDQGWTEGSFRQGWIEGELMAKIAGGIAEESFE